LNDEVVTKLPALPLTSGILTAKVVLSPLVKVKFLVPLLKDAVIKELAVTEELTNPNAVICALPDIVPGTTLPLAITVISNVLPSPFVNVITLILALAVVNSEDELKLPVKLAANIFPEELILVPSKEIFNDCPIPSCNIVIVPGTNDVLVPKCARD
jgi:hypothetical protein